MQYIRVFRSQGYNMRYYLLFFIVLGFGIAHADCSFGSTTSTTGSGLDNFLIKFCENMLVYADKSNGFAKKIFWILFSCEFLWQLSIKKIFVGDVEKLWVFCFTRLALGYFFDAYLVNIHIYQGIINFLVGYGASISNININISDTHKLFDGISPSSTYQIFTCASNIVHQVTDNTGSLSYITLKIFLAIAQLAFFLTMIGVAYLVMEVYIKTYFLLYVGFILTGFAGSSWTMNYWQKYLQQVSAVAIEFLTMCVLLGVLKSQIETWALLSIDTTSDTMKISGAFMNLLGLALIFLLLMANLPKWAGNKLAGEVKIRLDDKMTAVSGFMSGRR